MGVRVSTGSRGSAIEEVYHPDHFSIKTGQPFNDGRPRRGDRSAEIVDRVFCVERPLVEASIAEFLQPEPSGVAEALRAANRALSSLHTEQGARIRHPATGAEMRTTGGPEL